MAKLEVPVSTPGAAQSATEVDRLATSLTKAGTAGNAAATSTEKMGKASTTAATAAKGHGDAMEKLTQRLRSGEVLRNGATMIALLGTASDGAAPRIAALGGALAMIPGPIGAIGALVAVGGSVFDVLGRSADAAAKEVEALAKRIEELTVKRDSALGALAGNLTSNALKLGGGIRAYNASSATAGDLSFAQGLFPGDRNAALKFATSFADQTSGLTPADIADIKAALSDARMIGRTIDDSFLKDLVRGASELRSAATGEEVVGGRTALFGSIGEVVAPTETLNESLLSYVLGKGTAERVARARMNAAHEVALQLSESTVNAGAVTEQNAAVSGALTTLGSEALQIQMRKNSGATEALTKAITDLTAQIDAAKKQQAASTGGANTSAGITSGPRAWWDGGVSPYSGKRY